MEHCGHPAEDRRPALADLDPQRGAFGKQDQEHAEETDDHGEVLGAPSMACEALVCVTR